ncbi:hypothetical protein DESC_740039 [Desulfosarcina cetonica]|nr:hypothetical protein DESC_740039 [Desulfosarcina cetonica]
MYRGSWGSCSWPPFPSRFCFRCDGASAMGRTVPPDGEHPLLVDAGQAQILHLDILLDAVPRSLAADAGLLDAAEGGHFGGDQAGVDAHHAVFQGLGDPENASHVAGIEIGRQAEGGVIGHADDIGFAFETDQRRHRAESFVHGHLHVGAHVGQHGGLEEGAAQGVGLSATEQAGTARKGVVDVMGHLVHGGAVDQRSLLHAGGHAVSHLEGFHGGHQPAGEFVVNTGLHEQPVGAHAGLPGVAVFGDHGPFHGPVQVGVVEDDERCVAAQFQGDLLDRGRAGGHEPPADLGGAGEAEFAYRRVGGQLAADLAGRAGDHIENTGRNPRPAGQFGQGQGGQGRLAGRFDHHAAAGGQGRRGLAGDHGRREVPRGDRGADAHGLADDQNTLIRGGGGNGVAVNPFGFLGKPLHKGCGIGDFTPGLGQGFALLGGEDHGQILLVGHHQVVPFQQKDRALLGRQISPIAEGAGGCLNGHARFQGRQRGYAAHHPAVGRVGDADRAARWGRDPLPVHPRLLAQQATVAKCFHRFWTPLGCIVLI